jgi:hypothetical protein
MLPLEQPQFQANQTSLTHLTTSFLLLEASLTIKFPGIVKTTFSSLGEESKFKFIYESDTIDGRGGIMDEVSYRESYYGINA